MFLWVKAVYILALAILCGITTPEFKGERKNKVKAFPCYQTVLFKVKNFKLIFRLGMKAHSKLILYIFDLDYWLNLLTH